MKKDFTVQKTGFPALRFTWLGCLFVYLCLTGIHLYLHNRMVDTPAIEARRDMHKSVLQKEAPAPVQYRIMVFYIAEGLQRIGFSFKASYLIIRGVFLFAAAWLLHLFLLYYFSHKEAFAGVLILFAILPHTYIHYFMQEMDIPNLVFYIAAFILMVKRKDMLLFPLIFVAMFNRETPIFLPLIWLFYRWDEMPAARLAAKLSGYYMICFGVYIGLQKYFGFNPSYSKMVCFQSNLNNIHSYLSVFLILGFLLYPAFHNWDLKPKFLRRASLFIPFYIAFGLTFTIFYETRLLLPALVLLLPMAASSFTEPKAEPFVPAGYNVWIKKNNKLIYILLLALFVSGFGFLTAYGNKRFVEGYEKKKLAGGYLKEGAAFYQNNEYTKALKCFQQGIQTDPDNFDLHYNLGVLYYYKFDDKFRARIHFKECLKLDPDRKECRDIRDEILK